MTTGAGANSSAPSGEAMSIEERTSRGALLRKGYRERPPAIATVDEAQAPNQKAMALNGPARACGRARARAPERSRSPPRSRSPRGRLRAPPPRPPASAHSPQASNSRRCFGYRVPSRPGFGCLWELLPWRLWYFAHPKFGSRTISVRPPRKPHKPRSHRPMNRTLQDSRSPPCPLLRRLTALIRSEPPTVQTLPISGQPSFAKPDLGGPQGSHKQWRAQRAPSGGMPGGMGIAKRSSRQGAVAP